MTLDPEHDAVEDEVRAALLELRQVLVDHRYGPYVESVDHLLWAFDNGRPAFFRQVNGGGVWRNMGSIEDLGGALIWRSLIRLASALEAAGLADAVALEDAAILRERFEKGLVSD